MSSQQRGRATRAHILATAATCFAQQGYDGTGVAEICRRAGVTKGAFYHHFPSKQALFLALFDQWLQGMDAQIASVREEAGTTPEAFRRMAGMIQHVFAAAGGQLPMFLEFWSKAARDPAVWQATIAPYRQYTALFSAMIEAGIAEGTLRTADPQAAAQVVVSLAVGLVLQSVLDPEGADWGYVAQEGVRLLLEGLGQAQ